MHGHSAIAQHRLRARGRNRDVIALFFKDDVPIFVLLDIGVCRATCERVFEVPHVARNLDILDLKVRDRGFKMRIPVGQALAAIDEALLVHIHEDLNDGIVKVGRVFMACPRIARRAGHSKGVAVPVAGAAQALQLLDNRAAILAFPFPDLLQEALAPHIAAAFIALRGEHLFDLQLRGDARMVLTRLPERLESTHTVPADQDVLKRVVEGMSHMQRAGDIGRRDHDREAFVTRRIGACGEGLFSQPFLGDPCLGNGGVEFFVHRHGGLSLSIKYVDGDLSKASAKGKAKRYCSPRIEIVIL